jgi:hypothetical protein
MQPDEHLGYVPRPGYSGTDHGGGALFTFDSQGFRSHHRSGPSPSRVAPPILVVGDSYAMGVQVADDESWPAHLETALDRRVMNAGVPGYGIDQIVLRAEGLVAALRPDVMIVGFIADDVRRAEARILWGLDKPYFDIVGDALVLRNVPVKPPATLADGAPLDPVRRVFGYSFMMDVVMRRLGLSAWWRRGQASEVVPAHKDGARVACLLMKRLQRLGETYGVRILVLAQYSPQAWLRPWYMPDEAPIAAELLACAKASGLETLDTYAAVQAAVRAEGISGYYVDTHMNNRGNRLTATLLADQLRNSH